MTRHLSTLFTTLSRTRTVNRCEHTMIQVPQMGQTRVVVIERRTEEPHEQSFAASECPFVGNSHCKEYQQKILTTTKFTHV